VRVLLDTHSLLWYAQDNPKLSATANLAIEATSNTIFVSIVSLWEITIKNSIGKLTLDQPIAGGLWGLHPYNVSSKNHHDSNANQDIVPPLLACYWKEVHEKLCPFLEERGHLELTDTLRRLVQILEIVRIEERLSEPATGRRGRPSIDRRPLARAFLAKAVLNLSDTRQLIEQLHQSPSLRFVCGMKHVPSEPTFSRAFAAFARESIADKAHQSLVTRFVSEQIVMHASHDTTAVEAREKPAKKVKVPKVKKSGVAPRKERRLLKS
jgi:transposase